MDNRILDALHVNHPGITKFLATSYVWWPPTDILVRQKVKSCNSYQLQLPMVSKIPIHQRSIHKHQGLDFARPLTAKMSLILCEPYWKWTDIISVPNIASRATISCLRNSFAFYKLSHAIKIDNGFFIC